MKNTIKLVQSSILICRINSNITFKNNVKLVQVDKEIEVIFYKCNQIHHLENRTEDFKVQYHTFKQQTWLIKLIYYKTVNHQYYDKNIQLQTFQTIKCFYHHIQVIMSKYKPKKMMNNFLGCLLIKQMLQIYSFLLYLIEIYSNERVNNVILWLILMLS